MDFKELMKQASINQSMTQKKFEKSREKEKVKETIQKTKDEQKKQKANDKLKQYETDLIKSRLAYKGLLSSKGEPLTQKAHQQLERVKSNHTSSLSKPNITTTASSSKLHPLSATSKPHPSTGSSSSSSSRLLTPTASSSKSTGSSKSKSTSPRPLKSANDKSTPNKTKSITYKSQTPPPCIKKATAGKKGGVGGVGGPVNFQELLKLAQKNKKSGLAGSSLSSEKRGDETSKQQTGGPTKAGIGKALLDKQWRDKRKPPFEEKKATTPHNTATQERIEASTSGGSKPVTSGAVADTGRPTNGRTGAVAERVYPYELPYGERRRPGASSTESGRVGGGSRGQMAASGIRKQMVTGRPNGRGRGDQPIARGSGASSSIGRGGSNLRGSRPKSFYGRGGVPSSARLITDGPRGRSSSSASSMHYKSSWVDEMRDYVYNNPLELDEYEDGDDDLEDFVVDSYEDEGLEDGAEDYSSAIQEIFGSRYRTRVADEDDDVLMESSFAQQQFEEYRSARIGQMEDAEDIRKEQEMLHRKRSKALSAASGGTKKMKKH